MRQILNQVLGEIPDPQLGLPDPVFEFLLKVTPMINVDLLIRNDCGDILMAWREDEWGTGWHLPGGIIRYKEAIAHRIAEVARTEIGARVIADAAPCDVQELPDLGRGHFISMLYRCVLLDSPCHNGLAQMAEGKPLHNQLAWIEGVPEHLYPAHFCYKDWFVPVNDGPF